MGGEEEPETETEALRFSSETHNIGEKYFEIPT